MIRRILGAVAFVVVTLASPVAGAADAAHRDRAIVLSPDLLTLLRAEMAELARGIQGVALSLAAADWKAIQETGERMHASYIMQKSLTEAQAAELGRALPRQFKQLDGQFHARARRLGDAAAARDPELVAFHYARLVESCAECHAAFAAQRFPGFTQPSDEHHH